MSETPTPLLPCLRCGGEIHVSGGGPKDRMYPEFGSRPWSWFCTVCGIENSRFPADTDAEAIADANRRPAPPPVQGAGEPVAWMKPGHDGVLAESLRLTNPSLWSDFTIPLYTTPPVPNAVREARDILFAYGKNNEATRDPWWAITTTAIRGGEIVHAGPFFNRDEAEETLRQAAHRFPKKAHVYCFSGHNSQHYKRLRASLSPNTKEPT